MNEKMNIRGSIHDNAQIKSPSPLSQLQDFIFIATKIASTQPCLFARPGKCCGLLLLTFTLKETHVRSV